MVDIDGEPIERMEETLTSPYPIDDTQWQALLTAIAKQFEEIETTRDEVLASKFVDDATGEQLEKLASVFQIEKDASWTTSEFRSRIKVGLRSQLASGTIDEIEEVVSVLIGVSIEEVKVIETTDLEPATIQLDVPESSVDDSVLANVADAVTAVGVDVGIRVVLNTSDATAISDDVTTDFPDPVDTTVFDDKVVLDFPSPDDAVAFADSYETDFPTADTDGLAFSDEVESITDEPVTDSYWNEGTWNTSTDVWS